MPPYGAQPPTGYDDTADAWVNTGALVARMNFAVQLAANRLRGVSVAAPKGEGGEDAPLADLAVSRLLGGDVSDATRQTLERAEAPSQAAALALGSPEFQRR